MIKRLTEKEVLDRISYLWEKFHVRQEMTGVTYDEFKKECLEEYYKQNKMSDDELENYRNTNYQNMVKEANSLFSKEELEKLKSEDSKVIYPEEISK